jgi:hypothetical protein
MVAGFYDPPGAIATGLCIAHATLPKEAWLAKLGVGGQWPCWGLAARIHLDNAKEFHGEMLPTNRKRPGWLAQFHRLYHQFNRLCGSSIDF